QGYISGVTVSLLPTASTGSVFTGWSGACSFPDPDGCKLTLYSDQSVTATFSKVSESPADPSSGGNGGRGALSPVELCGMLLLALCRAVPGVSLLRVLRKLPDCGSQGDGSPPAGIFRSEAAN